MKAFKDLIKKHKKISKQIAELEKLTEDKLNKRLTDKKFNKGN